MEEALRNKMTVLIISFTPPQAWIATPRASAFSIMNLSGVYTGLGGGLFFSADRLAL